MNVCVAACESLVIKVLEKCLKSLNFKMMISIFISMSLNTIVTVKNNNGKNHLAN